MIPNAPDDQGLTRTFFLPKPQLSKEFNSLTQNTSILKPLAKMFSKSQLYHHLIKRPSLYRLIPTTPSRPFSTKSLTILGIETSCDDTSCSLITLTQDGKPKVLSHITAHQYKIHEPMGGIVPNLALKQHIKNLPRVIKKALEVGGKKVWELDAIAVTRGPGLPSSLSVGLNAGKNIAAACG